MRLFGPNDQGMRVVSPSRAWPRSGYNGPRTSIPSGFELGSGLFVNTVSPEEAAKQLSEVYLEEYN